ncbi:interleukin-13 receptor subunit alpha-2-like [Pagrus major]|uniref:interleukin-13 receptor subunit alpha-2-like n=1 Tax=Pagrus major TaxID=143350 RepID=UPI003CC851C4
MDLLVLCLFSTFESTTSQVLPPQNVSLRWIDDFWPQLSWTPPRHSVENCTYEVERIATNNMDQGGKFCDKQPFWMQRTVMQGRQLYLSVKTVCNTTQSEPFELNITYPELVRNLNCFIHSSKLTKCSWLPVSNAPDFSFFYELADIYGSDDSDTPLQACSAYSYTADGRRTGCDLQADINHDIQILFNGTLNNRTVRNTYTRMLKCYAKPLPLKWTVIKAGDKFNISWIPPDFGELSHWKFTIKHTACSKTTFFDRIDTSTELNVVPHCEQCLAIKVERKVTGGESEWSDEQCFDSEPNALVYAAIIIPLMFAVLAVLTFACCKKNKDIIFPKVPEPRDFLSDISDNNNKITVRNLCIPAEEDCKITLVIDPLNNKLLY